MVDQIATIVDGWRQLRFIYCSDCEHCANYDHIEVKNIQTAQFTLLSGSHFMGLDCSARICYTETLLNFLMEAATGIFSPDTFLFHRDYYAVVLILLLL